MNNLRGGDAGSGLEQDFVSASDGEMVGSGGTVEIADGGAVAARSNGAIERRPPGAQRCWSGKLFEGEVIWIFGLGPE